MEQPLPPPGTESFGLDCCTEFLDHIAHANKALVQLQKRCSLDRNSDDKEKIRTHKDRKNYHLIIQQSVNALLDEIANLGPWPEHDFHLRAAERTEMEQYQEQTTRDDNQLSPLIPEILERRLTMENELYTSQHESAPKPIRRMICRF